MYDPAGQSPPHPAQQYEYNQQQQPQSNYSVPQWSPYTTFHPGTIVWCAGTYWRCEVGHVSGAEPGGAPMNNLLVWTPVSSIGHPYGPPRQQWGRPDSTSYPTSYSPNYQQQQYLPSATTGNYQYSPSPSNSKYNYPYRSSSSSSTSSSSDGAPGSGIGALSPSMSLKPPKPPYSALHHERSDDSSSSGETVTEKSRGGGRPSGMEFFTAQAGDSIRYITMREEERKAQDKDELKDEIKGKRNWRVGGLGIFTYSLDSSLEDSKRDVWRGWSAKHGKEHWIKGAVARTKFYNETRGIKPFVHWKLVGSNNVLPPDALAIGHEADGQLLYAARSWFSGGLHLGKAAARTKDNASISYGGVEHLVDTYEILCGPSDPTLLKWISFRNGEAARVDGWLPVEGGREADGNALLVAKGDYENGQHPGKCLLTNDHACVGWGGGEVWVRDFEILAYTDAGRR